VGEKEAPRRGAEKSLPNSFIHDLLTGFKTLFLNKKIRFVAVTFFIFASIIGACYVVLVVFIQEALQSMTRYVGFFGMWIFLGVLAGSYLYGKVGQRISRSKTVFISILLVGISVALFAVVLKAFGSVFFGSIAAFSMGLFISPAYVTANTIVHESVDSDLRGRVFSSLGIIMNAGFISFMFLSSFLAEYIDRFWILIACGSISACLGLVGLISAPAGFLKDFTFSS
jgi:MFS family permease